MKHFFTRLTISALSLAVACYVVPGMKVDGLLTLLVAAFLFGIVNAIVRPILVILTLPLIVVSLGLFLFVINGLMLALVAWLLPGFSINGLGSAIIGWLILSLTGWVASRIFGESRERDR
jgi:putative membrane protein